MAKELKNSNATDNLEQCKIECYGPGMMLLIDITCFFITEYLPACPQYRMRSRNSNIMDTKIQKCT